jgi:hypothetical protein
MALDLIRFVGKIRNIISDRGQDFINEATALILNFPSIFARLLISLRADGIFVTLLPHHAEGRVDPVDLALKNRNWV